MLPRIAKPVAFNVRTMVIPYDITSEQAIGPMMSSTAYNSMFVVDPVLLRTTGEVMRAVYDQLLSLF
jgi:hypothetical protein